jgi:hypothetical protein
MRIPQVSEKVKEAPANALRSAFARVGQLLLVTDRMKNKSGDSKQTAPEDAATATEEEPAATAEAPAAPEAAGSAAADVAAGSGEAGGAAEADGATGVTGAPAVTTVASGAAETKAPATKPAARKPAAKKPAATTSGNVRLLPDEGEKSTPAAKAPAAPAVAEVLAVAEVPAVAKVPAAGSELPLANYDQLTVASLRARLRGLSIEQVRTLITYEQRHENRADIIAMFERRVAKLESES